MKVLRVELSVNKGLLSWDLLIKETFDDKVEIVKTHSLFDFITYYYNIPYSKVKDCKNNIEYNEMVNNIKEKLLESYIKGNYKQKITELEGQVKQTKLGLEQDPIYKKLNRKTKIEKVIKSIDKS